MPIAKPPPVPAPAVAAMASRPPPTAQTATGVSASTNLTPPQALPNSPQDPIKIDDELKSAPSLADTHALTPESDFRPFMGQGVAPEVKNAAMKKLFADPHFNVMDQMDTYIDDYSQADPLPLAMLRQMNGSKFLNLFEQDAPVEPSDSQAAGASEMQLQAVHQATADVTQDGTTQAANPMTKA